MIVVDDYFYDIAEFLDKNYAIELYSNKFNEMVSDLLWNKRDKFVEDLGLGFDKDNSFGLVLQMLLYFFDEIGYYINFKDLISRYKGSDYYLYFYVDAKNDDILSFKHKFMLKKENFEGMQVIDKWLFRRWSMQEVELPDGIKTIGEWAFYGCKYLTTINIPSSVDYMEKGIFFHCTDLQNVNIPEGITDIPEALFYGCWSLERFEVPNNITSLERDAFRLCHNLKDVKLPNRLEDLNSDCFSGCQNLRDITLPASIRNIAAGCFSGTNITELKYEGTKEQLSKVKISAFWNYNSTITKIKCSDGVIDLDD